VQTISILYIVFTALDGERYAQSHLVLCSNCIDIRVQESEVVGSMRLTVTIIQCPTFWLNFVSYGVLSRVEMRDKPISKYRGIFWLNRSSTRDADYCYRWSQCPPVGLSVCHAAKLDFIVQKWLNMSICCLGWILLRSMDHCVRRWPWSPQTGGGKPTFEFWDSLVSPRNG